MQQKIISNNEVNIFTNIYGEGPLIVLIHGWPESWYSWRHQIPFLEKLGYQVAAISVRGYGKSSKPYAIEEYSICKLASDIEAVIRGLGHQSAILIGHDWGGPIAWTTAIKYPNMVDAVVGLSVPYLPVGAQSSLDLWKQIYKDKYFYQLYFLNEGLAEKELEKDLLKTFELCYFSNDSRGMLFLNKNKDNPKYQKNKNSGYLEGLPEFSKYPSWLSRNDIDVLIDEFTISGMRGPLNRYRAQDIDFKELQELGPKKITQPAAFITGEHDPVNFFLSGAASKGSFGTLASINVKELFNQVLSQNYEDLRMLEVLENVGHWTQEEAPEEVNQILKKFLATLA